MEDIKVELNSRPSMPIKPAHCLVGAFAAVLLVAVGAVNLIHGGTIPFWGHTASIAFVAVDGSIAAIAVIAALAIHKKKAAPVKEVALPVKEEPLSKERISDLRIPLMLHVAGEKEDAKLEELIQSHSFFAELRWLDKKAVCSWVSNNCRLTEEKRAETVEQLKELLKICKTQGQKATGRFKELALFAALDPQLRPAFQTARKDKDYVAAEALLVCYFR